MVEIVTVRDWAKELGTSPESLLEDLRACGILKRELSAPLTPLEVQLVRQLHEARKQTGDLSTTKPLQTKRKILFQVTPASSGHRRATIQVEIRRKRRGLRSAGLNAPEPLFEEPPKVQDPLPMESTESLKLPSDLAGPAVPSVEPMGAKGVLTLEDPLAVSSPEAGPVSGSEESTAVEPARAELSPTAEVEGPLPLEISGSVELVAPEAVASPGGSAAGPRRLRSESRSAPSPTARKGKMTSKSPRHVPQSRFHLRGAQDADDLVSEEGALPPYPSRSRKSNKGGPRAAALKRSAPFGGQSGVKSVSRSVAVGLQQKFQKPVAPVSRVVKVYEGITVSELAEKLAVKAPVLIKELIKLGVMAGVNQALEADVVQLVAETLGHEANFSSNDLLEEELARQERLLAPLGSGETAEQARAPIVTVMGHVDHGKTSLLDCIRQSRVAQQEAGGITQHLGAYTVQTDHGPIIFLDTPGHAAFTAMRARGAKVTDVAVLVVAADDGVKPQTLEAIQHIQAASVPLVVALTKADLPEANPKKVSESLLSHGIVPEAFGGDTPVVPVSSKTGAGLSGLLDSIALQAECLQLRASSSGPVRGVVLEARVERGRGPVATVLVQSGTLKRGLVLLCGQAHGKVRALAGESGQELEKAGPSTPVALYGFSTLPSPGEILYGMPDEKSARKLSEHLKGVARAAKLSDLQKRAAEASTAALNAQSGKQLEIHLVLKADTHGTLEALKVAIEGLQRGVEEQGIKIHLRGYGVGAIIESDVDLAIACKAILFGFNVRPDASAKTLIERNHVKVFYPSIIYEVLDSLKLEITGRVAPVQEQVFRGLAEVRALFRSPKFGMVAGCLVLEGAVARRLPARIVRDGCVIFSGELTSLRKGKEDVAEVRQGVECGIGIKNYQDIRVGDRIEVFEVKEVFYDPFAASSDRGARKPSEGSQGG